MKKIVLLIFALLASAMSFAQIDVNPTSFHNGVALPSISAIYDTIHVKSPISMEGKKITNLPLPAAEGDAANKSYVDNQTATALQPGDNVSELVNDAGYIPNSEKAQPNGISTLDGNGKIPTSQLPPVAITETFVVGSETAMLATEATQGDVVVRTDLDKNFILQTEPPTTLANWVQLLSPNPPVQSVNGLAGTVSLEPAFSNGVLSITGSGGVTLDTRYPTKNEVDNSLSGKEDAFSKNSAFNKAFGTTVGTVVEGNDSRIINGQTAYSWGNFRDYGLGITSEYGKPIPNDDVNNINIPNGSYAISSGTTINAPLQTSGVLIVERSGANNYITQKVQHIFSDGKTRMFIRNYMPGSQLWGDWYEIANQSWVENQNYLTSFTELDPVYSASIASGITSGNITNWDGKAEIADIPTDNIQLTNGSHYVSEDKLGFGLSMTNDSLVSGEIFGFSGVNFIAYPSYDSIPGFIMAENAPYFALTNNILGAISFDKSNKAQIEITAVGGNTGIKLVNHSPDGEETAAIIIDAGSPQKDLRISSDEFSLRSIDNFIDSSITNGLSIESNNRVSIKAPSITTNLSIAKIELGGSRSIVTKAYSDLNRLTITTVYSLPGGSNATAGDQYIVTDAATPSWNSIVTGGGSTTCVVYYDGTNWIAH